MRGSVDDDALVSNIMNQDNLCWRPLGWLTGKGKGSILTSMISVERSLIRNGSRSGSNFSLTRGIRPLRGLDGLSPWPLEVISDSMTKLTRTSVEAAGVEPMMTISSGLLEVLPDVIWLQLTTNTNIGFSVFLVTAPSCSIWKKVRWERKPLSSY